MKRTILHVDMDAFFAAVELQRHPELKSKPVVVGGGGDPTQRGVVSTASYVARQYGISSGMPLRRAYQLCPDAVFLPVDYRTYVKVSKTIKAILHAFSNKVEDIGLDEAFLDVTGLDTPPGQLAKEIKKQIKAQTGLSCSVGIAPNKLLAKIASDLEKPDGLTQLSEDDIPARVWPLPVRTIWGVGPKTEVRLARRGITTIGELATLSLETLIGLFGQAHGHHLYQAARGIDESPVISHRRRKSLGRETTFQYDITDPEILSRVLEELTRAVVGRLRQYHYTARTVTIKLRFADFETHTRSATLADASDELTIIEETALMCLDRITLTKPVRLVGVRLSQLETRMKHH